MNLKKRNVYYFILGIKHHKLKKFGHDGKQFGVLDGEDIIIVLKLKSNRNSIKKLF